MAADDNLSSFATENAYYPDHKAQNRSIQRYLRWRNDHRKDPKLLKEQKKVKVA